MTIETGGIPTGRGIWYDTLSRKGTAKVSPPETRGMQVKKTAWKEKDGRSEAGCGETLAFPKV